MIAIISDSQDGGAIGTVEGTAGGCLGKKKASDE